MNVNNPNSFGGSINAETANYVTIVANSHIAVLTELLEDAEPDELTITTVNNSVNVGGL